MKLTYLFTASILGASTLIAFNPIQAAADHHGGSHAGADYAAPVAEGTFTGQSSHDTSGGASITGTRGEYTLVFADDFAFDGAPDPVVGFGSNGQYDTSSKVAKLTSKTGTQSYALPADFDPASATEVYIWCEQYSVPLGVASFDGAAAPASKPAAGS